MPDPLYAWEDEERGRRHGAKKLLASGSLLMTRGTHWVFVCMQWQNGYRYYPISRFSS
jgi:hypothetical protein